MDMRYDLIIIGSGSVGSAAGYYATQAGLKVPDDRCPPSSHAEGSHHGDTGLFATPMVKASAMFAGASRPDAMG